jgi:hypothetical protein
VESSVSPPVRRCDEGTVAVGGGDRDRGDLGDSELQFVNPSFVERKPLFVYVGKEVLGRCSEVEWLQLVQIEARGENREAGKCS